MNYFTDSTPRPPGAICSAAGRAARRPEGEALWAGAGELPGDMDETLDRVGADRHGPLSRPCNRGPAQAEKNSRTFSIQDFERGL